MKAIFKNKWVYGAVIAAAGIWYFQGDSSSTTVEFQTGPLSVGDVESIVNTAGTLSPLSIVDVGSEVSGLIVELNVDFNSVVKEGDLLARIDDRDVRVLLRQREADLQVSRANLIQEKAALLKAETDYEFSENELERSRSLLERQLDVAADGDTACLVCSAVGSLHQAGSATGNYGVTGFGQKSTGSLGGLILRMPGGHACRAEDRNGRAHICQCIEAFHELSHDAEDPPGIRLGEVLLVLDGGEELLVLRRLAKTPCDVELFVLVAGLFRLRHRRRNSWTSG